MKAIAKFFAGLFFFVSLCALASCSACSACIQKKLSDNLFNGLVLRFYDIPWLKKPDDATEDSVHRVNGAHQYQAYLPSEESFWEYGEYIYEKMVGKDYTLGSGAEYMSSGDLFTYQSWVLTEKPTSFEDCCQRDGDFSGVVRIYYSKKSLSKFDAEKHGYKMKNAFVISLKMQEAQGKALLFLTCDRENDAYMRR